ncbi:MAG: 50S ribosomal protein L19 [Candidatus Paceibacterota bacterium]
MAEKTAKKSEIKISPVNIEERKALGIKAGDTIRVWQKIQEKGKIRLQAFEGIVLARKHGSEAGATFTVRRIVDGIGVEKIFPLYSPVIDKIEIVKRVRTRRAKLYYIREKVAKEIKKQMRKARMSDLTTKSETEEKKKKDDKILEEQKEKETQQTDLPAQAGETKNIMD